MAFKQPTKERVKQVADIVELIGQFVQLRKTGRNFVGLCPFHAEKAPSFTVSPERQMFHCFGCKKGGDIFAFWMDYHGCTFTEALKDLAQRYNIEYSERDGSEKDKRETRLREALFRINNEAATYFQKALNHSVKGKSARAYLAKRQLPGELISEFRLGYAPEEWQGLVEFLKHREIDLDVAVKAGLIIPRKTGGYYDRFRGRIVFPILNLTGQVVGFGGRVLDNSNPKYLNTPETAVFHKGEVPYGLHAAHRSIREMQRAVIVEGYMDLLALRCHGLQEVVATLGTALTANHVRKLKGYANTVVVVFDSDEAGKSAVLKSAPLFLNEAVSAKAVVLPDGHDPDSFVNRYGLEAFSELLDKALPMLDFYLEQRAMGKDASIEEKLGVLKELFPVLSALRSAAQRALYVRRLSERIGIRERVVWSELDAFGSQGSAYDAKRQAQHLNALKAEKRYGHDLHFLNLLIHHPRSIGELKNCDWRDFLSDPVVLEIVEQLFSRHEQEGEVNPEGLMDELKSDEARRQLRELLLMPSFYSDQGVEQAVSEFEAKIRQCKISRSLRHAKGDAETLNRLLELKRRDSR